MKILVIAISFLLLTGCGGGESQTAQLAPRNSNLLQLSTAQLKNTSLKTGTLTYKAMGGRLRLNGRVEVPPQNMVSVSVPLGGYLKTTSLIPGMAVRKGQVLAVVEDQQYIQLQQDYLTARARIAFLKNEYERQRDLNQSKASSDKVADQSLAEYKTQLVQLSALQQKLALAGIAPASLRESNISRTIAVRSPVSGFVSQVYVNRGKYLSPTDVLFDLVNPSDMHLTLHVFEKDLAKLYKGQKLWAYTNSQPQKRYACTISLISRNLSNDRSAEVHCHFEQVDAQLVPGVYMNAEVELAGSKTALLPDDAVLRFEGKDYVFVQKGAGSFEMLEVLTGLTEEGWVEIKNTASLQQQPIVISGAYTLLMALKNRSDD